MSNLLGSTIVYILVECSLFTSFHPASSPVCLNTGVYVQQELYSTVLLEAKKMYVVEVCTKARC